MAAGSVAAGVQAPIQTPAQAPARPKPNWKLAPPHDAQAQGLVASGFAGLPTGRALFLEFAWTEPQNKGGGWLKTLAGLAPISDADGRDERAASLAFTWTGLQRMGLPQSALDSFARPFREGMFQEDRMRRLGDRRRGVWQETVVKAGPQWSANTPLQRLPSGPDEEEILTPTTVHALLMLYEATEAAADAWAQAVEAALAPHQVKIVHRLPLLLDVDQTSLISREHFGFADGVSQPQPCDAEAVTLAGQPVPPDAANSVPLGEFLIGHLNGHREKAPGPVTPDSPQSAGLPPHPQAEGFRDLGLNGSYMVVRQLSQNVAAFWNSLAKGAERIRELDPQHAAAVTADWLAERVVGRSRDGHLLCPAGYLGPDAFGQPQNDFLFRATDGEGRGCPVGSHVRRANPRDSLAPDPAMGPTLLAAANNHRILRRGRKYGPKLEDPTTDDGQARGLLFVCLNTDIARQFEFVQQTWLLNQNFSTLFDETDPLLGPKGTMTLRDQPLRRIVEVETFVQLVGGDYFFLPSLPALAYLASL
jgi:deferrochelatase/peroxidase EfeB